MLENMQGDIYALIKNVENSIIKTYNRQNFIKDLKSAVPIQQLRADYNREAFYIATNYFDTSEGLLALYVYDKDDQIISTYRKAVTPKHNYPVNIYDEGNENNAAIVKDYVHSQNTTMLISGYYNEHRDADIIRFVMKLYNHSKASEMRGYLVCDIDSKVFRYRMEKFITNPEMFIWLQPFGDKAVIHVGALGFAQLS